MQITTLTRDDCILFLSSQSLGRLACTKDGVPHVTPIFFVCHEPNIYSFSTVGKKIEWLRNNPVACLQVDKITSPQEWTSVIVTGRYDELKEPNPLRETAHTLLQNRRIWWEPGYARTVTNTGERPLEPLYFRLSMDEVSGRKASP